MFDIGGGSTELVIGHGRQTDFHVSTQAGVVRQSRPPLHSDPPSTAELDALAEDVRIDPRRGRAGPVSRARWTGRSASPARATSLAAIAQGLDPYDPDRVQGYV